MFVCVIYIYSPLSLGVCIPFISVAIVPMVRSFSGFSRLRQSQLWSIPSLWGNTGDGWARRTGGNFSMDDDLFLVWYRNIPTKPHRSRIVMIFWWCVHGMLMGFFWGMFTKPWECLWGVYQDTGVIKHSIKWWRPCVHWIPVSNGPKR